MLKEIYRTSVSKLPIQVRRQILHFRAGHRFLNLHTPKSFSAKVNWRIIHDRRGILAATADKAQMKEIARAAGAPVPSTLWRGDDLEELTKVQLPTRWVLKPNNSSGRIFFGTGQANLAQLRHATKDWLNVQPSLTLRDEWAYSQASTGFLVEEAIGEIGADLPDYKLFVFDGRVEMIQVDTTRFSGHKRRLYTSSWQALPIAHRHPLAPIQEPPRSLEEMLSLARKVAEGFDFLRVDFYEYDGNPYFGEVAAYPGGGLEPYIPRSFDVQLGMKWTLPKETHVRGEHA